MVSVKDLFPGQLLAGHDLHRPKEQGVIRVRRRSRHVLQRLPAVTGKDHHVLLSLLNLNVVKEDQVVRLPGIGVVFLDGQVHHPVTRGRQPDDVIAVHRQGEQLFALCGEGRHHVGVRLRHVVQDGRQDVALRIAHRHVDGAVDPDDAVFSRRKVRFGIGGVIRIHGLHPGQAQLRIVRLFDSR